MLSCPFSSESSLIFNSSMRLSVSAISGSFILAGIFETVAACFFQSYLHQAPAGKFFETFVNFHAQVFRGRNLFTKNRHVFVQVFMIQGLEDFPRHKLIQFAKMSDHARRRIQRTGYRDLRHIIVPVAVWIVALAINPAVLLSA